MTYMTCGNDQSTVSVNRKIFVALNIRDLVPFGIPDHLFSDCHGNLFENALEMKFSRL
jgi:hypothetical protein